jgi:hypothetical protein
MRFWRWVIFASASCLVACVSVPTPEERTQQAEYLANQHGWHRQQIQAGHFTLQAFLPTQLVKAETAVIYLEGDGLAWLDYETPSNDPSPINPIALRLAIAQPVGLAAYLARPCQFQRALAESCPRKYWTQSRFSPEVVQATSQAIDALKSQLSVHSLVLVGYSGGGTLAALVAAQRHDVIRLLTVASVLDTTTWAERMRLSPLLGSSNPALEIERWVSIPQRHLIGDKDKTIPLNIWEEQKRWLQGASVTFEIIHGFDHRCCWSEIWAERSKLWLFP